MILPSETVYLSLSSWLPCLWIDRLPNLNSKGHVKAGIIFWSLELSSWFDGTQ